MIPIVGEMWLRPPVQFFQPLRISSRTFHQKRCGRDDALFVVHFCSDSGRAIRLLSSCGWIMVGLLEVEGYGSLIHWNSQA